MKNQLWLDIQAQSENLRSVIEHLYGHERKNIDETASFLRTDRPIVLVGIASAAYLCLPAETYLCQKGRLASVICASEAIYNRLPALKDAKIPINSRSGETGRRCETQPYFKRKSKIPFALITNEPESSAPRLADHVIWTNTRKDLLVSINIITGMMSTTLVTAAAVVNQMDVIRPAFDRLVNQFPSIVQQAAFKADELAKFFDAICPIYLLYRGLNKRRRFMRAIGAGRSSSISLSDHEWR